MTFNKYQIDAIKTLVPEGDEKLLIARLALGCAGESGEISEKVKKYLRGDFSCKELKNLLSAEIGDVLWYCATLSHSLGISLDDIAKDNIKKLLARMKKGNIKGSGDNR